MQFNLPTTKEEMYQTLNELYNFYRIKREGFEEVSLKELQLERLVFEKQTAEQMIEKANILVAEKQEREILEKQNQLSAKVNSISQKISEIQSSASARISALQDSYLKSQEKLGQSAIKNGLINSSAYLDKYSYLENEKNLQIAKINQDKDQEIASLNQEKLLYQQELDGLQEYFNAIHQKQVQAKVVELNDEQDKIQREVFKYNNGLDEKEQRYKNEILKANASLNLKFMEISSGEFSKEQLVDMGYYDDVLRCVCGYLDTMSDLDAYRTVSNESKLTIYLDDYYHNLVYMYCVRAGVVN